MANAGTWAVNIGKDAASGAGIGTMIFPGIGSAIGAGVGALGGALETLLTSSDDAKKRRQLEEEYKRRALEQAQAKWQQKMMALGGVDPRVQMVLEPSYDPNAVNEDATKYAQGAIPEQPVNYGALVQSLGSLGSTVGGLARADQLANLRNQSNQLGNIRATGNPWANYALGDQSDALDELLNDARDKAWAKTGGW